MTATNIRIMEEIAENKLFEHDLEATVCAQPAQPVRPVQETGETGLHGLQDTARGPTGQTGVKDRSDRSPPITKTLGVRPG